MAEVTEPIMLDSTGKEINANISNLKSSISDAMEKITNAVEKVSNAISYSKKDGIIYGFHIDGNESDPASKVTYLMDAVGMTPAYMDFSTDEFSYGSWENAFFMPKPCMLTSSGVVSYYLKPSDYTKKEDGTASDVANTSFDGNAMMEWGQNGKKIWLKVVPSADSNSADIYIADHKADSDFNDYAFHNYLGESKSHFYTPIYNGSLISSKIRSLSGQAVMKTQSGTNEITYAKANNPSGKENWNIELINARILINFLLILIGKSTNIQNVFGQGLNSGGNEAVNNSFVTGVHNTKGLFYGTNSGAAATYTNSVKIFGMENYYGFQWRRTAGYILANGVQKIKMTYGTEDGSTVNGYNTDGNGYISIGVTPAGTSGGYIDKMIFTKHGMFAKNASGSATTHYCDGLWFSNNALALALFGGRSNAGLLVGPFCCSLDAAVSYASWNLGASLSYV